MAEDAMVVDVEPSAKKGVKRKRALVVESLSKEGIEARFDELHKELNCLFKCYKEVLNQKVGFGLESDLSGCCGSSSNSVIAWLLEESSLPLSKLVDEIYAKIKGRESISGGTTLASVKGSVLLIGQRMSYGVPNPDADLLEDETESCLWCWETRDGKLMPKSIRGILKIRRIFRKRIQERIIALYAMIAALKKLECNQNCSQELMKASERLGKVLSEADIRLLLESMLQKNGDEMAEKEVKREEKRLIKQLEKNKREVEMEKRRIDRELQKEKLFSEKELKRLQDEAEKEERRREKEESEMRKVLRRQQEEVEKDQRRREKEEAEMKRQLALQKQASLMERFLKSGKSTLTSKDDKSSTKATHDSSPKKTEKLPESVTVSMDYALSLGDEIDTDELWKSHLTSWRHLGHSIRSNSKQHWGIRHKPKMGLVKELKLATSFPRDGHDDDLSIDKLDDGWEQPTVDDRPCQMNGDRLPLVVQKRNRCKVLLQFDKSHRPAFYGIWPNRSEVVGPRQPFKKDPDLDYEIDSDEEWEEEEPGESLSDCDDNDEEDSFEEGCSKADDENESEDGFFVPDGYLSENEGVQVDRAESVHLVDEVINLTSCKPVSDSEELDKWFRQRKYLNNITENALRKNQPLILLNLTHEKAPLSSTADLTGTQRVEQMCLQALSMCAFSLGPSIEISFDNNAREVEAEAGSFNCRGNTTLLATSAAIPDSDLLQIVSVIQSCSQSISKVVESLQQKFPTFPKSQLRNKVREISDFVDNRWQVKKDVLDKFGLSISPEKGGKRRNSIATFFSKRCMPLDGETNPNENSPLSSHKYSCSEIQLSEDPKYINLQ